MSFQRQSTFLIYLLVLVLFYKNIPIGRISIALSPETFINLHPVSLRYHCVNLPTNETSQEYDGFYFSNGNGDSSNDSTESDSGKKEVETEKEEKPVEETPSETKGEENPPPEEKPPQAPGENEPASRSRSRIPTYDDFARYRDLNRPPDSHYFQSHFPRLSGGRKPSTDIFIIVILVVYYYNIFVFRGYPRKTSSGTPSETKKRKTHLLKKSLQKCLGKKNMQTGVEAECRLMMNLSGTGI